MSLNPSAQLRRLGTPLGEHTQDLVQEGGRFAGRENARERTFQVLRGTLAQRNDVIDAVELDSVDRDIHVRRITKQRVLGTGIDLSCGPFPAEASGLIPG